MYWKGPHGEGDDVWLEAKMFGLWVSLCAGRGAGAEKGDVWRWGTEGQARAGRRNKGHGSAGVVLGGMGPGLVRVGGEELDLGVQSSGFRRSCIAEFKV